MSLRGAKRRSNPQIWREVASTDKVRPLNLAVFNACQSAEYVLSAAQAFSAAGRARAAIGHPDPVRDDEAVRFAACLYAELARGGYPLEEAFERACRQVSTHTPSLFGQDEIGLPYKNLSIAGPLVITTLGD